MIIIWIINASSTFDYIIMWQIISISISFFFILQVIIFVKENAPYSFGRLRVITVVFPKNSEMKTICDFAFDDSEIQFYTIPRYTAKISNHAFSNS